MKVKAFLIILLLCCLQQSVAAANSDYVYEVAMAVGEETGTSGAAILFDPQQELFLTTLHTIENGKKWNSDSYLTVDVYGKLFRVEILAFSKKHDLVLFRGPIKKESKKLQKLSLSVPKKDREIVAASLRPGVTGMTPVSRTGVVKEIKNWTIAISSQGEEGMSGGGIFSGDGKLVGLIAKKFDDKQGGILGANTNALEYFLEVSISFIGNKKVYDADALAYASK